jgi:hypothetical protein
MSFEQTLPLMLDSIHKAVEEMRKLPQYEPPVYLLSLEQQIALCEEQRCHVCYRPIHYIMPDPEFWTTAELDEAHRQLAKLCCSEGCRLVHEFPGTL